MPSSVTTGPIFISYANTDVASATEIRDLLDDNGYTYWMAPESISGPAPWAVQIVDAIRNAPLMLIVMSEAANNSSHVSREVDIAVDDGIPLLPVRIEDVQPSGSLGYLLRLQQWTDALGSAAQHGERILRAVAAIVRSSDDPGQPTPADSAESQVAVPLPLPPDSFLGRGVELETVANMLGRHRIVTLVGSAGTGKTRLALEATSRLADRFRDGVHVVDLSRIEEGDLVAQMIGGAMGLRVSSDARTDLASRLANRSSLIVLDGCDHVIDATAVVAEALVQGTQNLRVLTTSREPLHIAGEAVFRVEPLEVPAADEDERAVDTAAVQLFIDRARQVSDPSLDDHTVGVIAGICRSLDGIPLAIELAAARCAAFTPSQIADMLTDRLSLLTGGHRTSASHHRTLEAAIAWSYEELDPAEQAVFERASAFAGSFTIGATRAVTDLGDLDRTVPIVVAGLVDKSLLLAVPTDANLMRYRMMSTVRDFAHRRLEEGNDLEDVTARYVRHWASAVMDAERRLFGTGSEATLARLGSDHADVRQALHLAIAAGDQEAALRLAAGLALLWLGSGLWSNEVSWLERRWAKEGDEPATGSLRSGLLALANIETPAEALAALARYRLDAGDAEGAIPLLAAASHLSSLAGDRDPVSEQDKARTDEDFHDAWLSAASIVEQLAAQPD